SSVVSKRVLEVRVVTSNKDSYPNFKAQLFEKNDKSKNVHFTCHYLLQNGMIKLVPGKRHSCAIETDIWTKKNFIEMGRVIIAWFTDQVMNLKAVSTEDDTFLWHQKKIPEGFRYTLYDCSKTFVRINLVGYKKILSRTQRF